MPAESIEVTLGAPLVRRREAGGFRVSVAEFDGSHRLPLHRHEWACLSVVLEGAFVQRFRGAEYECSPGGLLTKPAEELHADRWCGVRSRHVIIEPDPEHVDRLGPLSDVAERVAFRLDPWALGLGRRMAREILSPDDVTDLALESMALELLVRVRRGGEAERRSRPPRWLEKIRDCLRDRHHESLRLEDLAAEAGVHASALSRRFRAHYGTTPAAYLRRVRLDAAIADLEAHRGSLSEVAHRHGFADQSHLTRRLKRATGLTPGAYRAGVRRD